MADGDINLATLWIPVAPETSKVGPAMEEAGKEAKTKFGQGVKDLGHTITEDLEKVSSKAKDTFTGVGSSIKDIFSRAGRESSESLSSSFANVGSNVKDSLAKAGADGGHSLVANFMSESGGLGQIADNLGKQIGGKFGGAIGDALKQIPGVAGATDALQGVADKAQSITDRYSSLKGQVKDVTDLFEDFKNKAPGIAGGFAMIAEAAGPVAALMATIVELWPQIKANMDYDSHKTPSGGVDWWKLGVGNAAGGWLENQYNRLIHGHSTPTGLAPPGAAPPAGPVPPGMLLGPGTSAGSADQPAPPSHYGPLGGDSGFGDLFGGGSGIGGAGGASWSGSGYTPSAANLPDVRGAHTQEAYAFQAIKQMFPWAQLTAGNYDHPKDQGWHGRGQAIDIGGGTAEQQAQLSNWLTQFAPEIEELIHQGPGVSQNIKSGRLGPAIDMPGSVYNTGQAGYHGDHVHLAVTDPQAQAFISALGGPTLPPGALSAGSSAVAGRGGGGLGPSGVGQGPIGTSNDPIYTAQAQAGNGVDVGGGTDGTGGAGGQGNSQAEQLGKGLVNGLTQELGLDGSVFKGFGGASNPLQFGSVKAGLGLLNFGLGLAHQHGGMGGMGGVSGGGGGIPGMGAIPTGPGGGAQNVNTGNGDVTNNYYHGPVGGTTINGVGSVQDQQFQANKSPNGMGAADSRYGPAGMAPNAGQLPSTTR